jgi:hypothetical protein
VNANPLAKCRGCHKSSKDCSRSFVKYVNARHCMKSKFISLLVSVVFAGVLARAETQPPITIAVLNCESPYKPLLRDVTSLVTADLSANPRFSLVERSQLKKVLGEEALGASGNINPDTAARIGQLTGAKILVSGHIFKVNGEIVVTASVVGADTGRIFATTESATWTNVMTLSSNLAGKLSQTITDQYTNLIANEVSARDDQIERLLKSIKGTQRPSVSIRIDEQVPGDARKKGKGRPIDLEKNTDAGGKLSTTETEMGLLFQKAGFKVVDEKSEERPDVVITGNAVTDSNRRRGNFFSCAALVEIKAQDRKTGNVLLVDRQESTAVDIGKQTAVEKALAGATDELAERLLPVLAQ